MCLIAKLENLPLIAQVGLNPKLFTFNRWYIARNDICLEMNLGYGTGKL
jgi:hypothetical protein